MRARSILFNAPMVRAILAGNKTQTRRAVKHWRGGQLGVRADATCREARPGEWCFGFDGPRGWSSLASEFACPYGQTGDRLWVRETWYCDDYRVQSGPYVKPDDFDVDIERQTGGLVYAADGASPYEAEQPVWRPSIHMPRWASRITLEITGVRVERLKEISEEDAKAEGCEPVEFERDDDCGNGWTEYWYAGGFERLWESTNGPGSWDANPFVWVIEFKRVTP